MPGFHVELSNILVFLLGVLLTAVTYYVRTQIALAAPAKTAVEAIGTRLEALARELMAKIDELRDALQAVNVTLGRSEERLAHNDREIERLDERMTHVERRLAGGA